MPVKLALVAAVYVLPLFIFAALVVVSVALGEYVLLLTCLPFLAYYVVMVPKRLRGEAMIELRRKLEAQRPSR